LSLAEMLFRTVRCSHAARSALCTTFSRALATSTVSRGTQKIDMTKLLSKPTWSVASLMPSQKTALELPEITSKQLHHLLRLSALPPPKDAHEEEVMLTTLSSQLHFVKDIQKVDTTGLEPLKSLRDETAQGEKEAEVGLEALADALAGEEIRGKHHKRIRRRRDRQVARKEPEWNVLGSAAKKVGRYFVVEGGKDR